MESRESGIGLATLNRGAGGRMENAIDISNLWKCFSYFGGVASGTLKEWALSLVHRERQRKVVRKELYHGLSLVIHPGEVVAFLGRNGSGKSTLLKIISGIYTPDVGHVHVAGRLSALIELGAGFHPDFSGRENVIVYGQVLGLTKKFIETRMQEIIDFAELDHFIDQPVKVYSSGMYMRLAFSVAVNVDPDILIIDEILSVGDYKFSQKCRQKMDEFKRRGKTICLVSHDMETVRSWATRAVVLDQGRVAFDGQPEEAVDYYLKTLGVSPQSPVSERVSIASSEDSAILAPGNAFVWQNGFRPSLLQPLSLNRLATSAFHREVVVLASCAADLLAGGYAFRRFFLLQKVLHYIWNQCPVERVSICVLFDASDRDVLLQICEQHTRKLSLSGMTQVWDVVDCQSRSVPLSASRSFLISLDWVAGLQTALALQLTPDERVVFSPLLSDVEPLEIPRGEAYEIARQFGLLQPDFFIEDGIAARFSRLASGECSLPPGDFHVIAFSDVGLQCSYFNFVIRGIVDFLSQLIGPEKANVMVWLVGDATEPIRFSESTGCEVLGRKGRIHLPLGAVVGIGVAEHGRFKAAIAEMSTFGVPVVDRRTLAGNGGSFERNLGTFLHEAWMRRSFDGDILMFEFGDCELPEPDESQIEALTGILRRGFEEE